MHLIGMIGLSDGRKKRDGRRKTDAKAYPGLKAMEEG
jgi:hypothetical protein